MSIYANKSGIVPAALAFLTIYNPSLSQTDDTIKEQVVYYYSKSNPKRSHRKASRAPGVDDKENENEKLRQIGLAQGMVQFARTFSDGQAVDTIETEKSRIILREIEAGWWLLASIDLTRILSPSKAKASSSIPDGDITTDIEYSAREVSPPALLLEQVIQAHKVFLLHHARTLTELFSRLPKPKFCAILERFWDDFVWNWDVLLHGNPAADVFGGLKLAAGGELGIGVGEEEWGSGEREVLEGFIGRTDGLVDLIVSRFGEAATLADFSQGPTSGKTSEPSSETDGWHLGQDPQPSDGVVFSGTGAISKPSVKHISNWVESLFKYGENAYGVRDNPVAINRQRRTKPIGASPSRSHRPLRSVAPTSADRRSCEFGIPAPVVGKQDMDRNQQQKALSETRTGTEFKKQQQQQPQTATTDSGYAFKTDTLMKYMTLGIYGSRLSAPLLGPPKQSLDVRSHDARKSRSPQTTSPGYFLIGLRGDLDEENDSDDNAQDIKSANEWDEVCEEKAQTSRIVLRTLVVEQVRKEAAKPAGNSSLYSNAAGMHSYSRLRVVVYINRPFIFTFLFDPQTDSLAITSFYRSLHHQLGPLQRPLLNSTSPSKVSERLLEASAPKSTVTTRNSQPIYDLVYDPYNLSVHTTIPNIPEPGSTQQTQATNGSSWTRVEALSVHSQMLNMYSSTRRHQSEVERTCKSNRGWWVVWMRLPHVAASQQLGRIVYREAFLMRKASDYGGSTDKATGGVWGKNASSSGAGSGGGPSKVAEGIGIDARQYIEGLVGLNR
ncbi:MAG: hypothetical protein Q9166_003528 [cf. Caloplaca sp. 2 TL-2023]